MDTSVAPIPPLSLPSDNFLPQFSEPNSLPSENKPVDLFSPLLALVASDLEKRYLNLLTQAVPGDSENESVVKALSTLFSLQNGPADSLVPVAAIVRQKALKQAIIDEEKTIPWDCDKVRAKIREFLATKEMTQTAFLKALHINSNTYRRFMSYNGPHTGSKGGLYSAAYLFLTDWEAKKRATEKLVEAAVKAAEKVDTDPLPNM